MFLVGLPSEMVGSEPSEEPVVAGAGSSCLKVFRAEDSFLIDDLVRVVVKMWSANPI